MAGHYTFFLSFSGLYSVSLHLSLPASLHHVCTRDLGKEPWTAPSGLMGRLVHVFLLLSTTPPLPLFCFKLCLLEALRVIINLSEEKERAHEHCSPPSASSPRLLATRGNPQPMKSLTRITNVDKHPCIFSYTLQYISAMRGGRGEILSRSSRRQHP